MEITFGICRMKGCIFTKRELFHICFRRYSLKLEQYRTAILRSTSLCGTLFLQAALEMFVNIRQILEKCLPLNSILVKMQPAETYIP